MTIRVFSGLLFAAYFIEVGLVLVVTPWSSFWDQNYFAQFMPVLGAVTASPVVRGAVTGVGVLTAIAGVVELARVFIPATAVERGSRRPSTPGT